MEARAKKRRRGHTRVSAKHQVTLPVDALEAAGIRTGDVLRAEPSNDQAFRRAVSTLARGRRRHHPGWSTDGHFHPSWVMRS